MEIGVCAGFDSAEAAAKAGFEFLEGSVRAVLVPESPEEEFAKLAAQAKKLPLRLAGFNLFLPGDLKVVGPGRPLSRMRGWVETACRRCAALGSRFIVFGSGGSRKAPEGCDPEHARSQILEFLDLCASSAARAGIDVVIEPLNSKDTNTITTLAEAVALAETVDRERIKVLVDLWHLAVEKEPLESIERAGSRLAHVHVAEPEGRLAPGKGGGAGALVRFMGALKRAGYDGGISVECKWGDFASEAPGAVRALREAWEKAQA